MQAARGEVVSQTTRAASTGSRYLLGAVAFYVTYLAIVTLMAGRHLRSAEYQGTTAQAKSAFGMVVAETAFWAIFVALGQGLTMAWAARSAHLSFRSLLGIQILVAALSVLLSDFVSFPSAILFMPMGLTTMAYGLLRFRGRMK